jgi:transcriptional regulator with XRE-family HTH domain
MECSDSYHWIFPKRFRLLIDETRVSQQEIADHVGVSRQAISQWKNGVTIPDMYHFRKVADFFNVPMEYLLGETESRLRENINAANDLGLSDKAITKLQEWAKENNGDEIISLAPTSRVLSDIISCADFQEFITRIRLYIAEYAEQRLHENDGHNKEYFENTELRTVVEHNEDERARILGLRTLRAEDYSAFNKYQAIEALERVLYPMPEDYYRAYQAQKEEDDDGEYSAEEE